MDSVLADYRTQLDVTGDPQYCIRIADRLEEIGGNSQGWRWLGEHGKTPHRHNGMFHFWCEEALSEIADDAAFEFDILPANLLPLQRINFDPQVDDDDWLGEVKSWSTMIGSNSRIGLFDTVAKLVSNALDFGLLE